MTIPNALAATDADQIVHRAVTLSRFARHLLAADPGLLPATSVRTPFSADEMRTLLAAAETVNEPALKRALRDLRKRVMLRVITRDLGGLATLDEVVATVTALADIAITTSVAHLERWLADEYGTPTGEDSGLAQKLHVIGMGKLGGCELNVSSDIDLVFAYPEDGETHGARPLSNHEYFTRFARRLIALLTEMTADGYVFRVDMRLRPLGADGPLACSFGMLENYFVTQGREWERYAWIKGRIVCGDRAQELLDLVRPFVFRRHLDYSAFAALRELHHQIRREVERRDMRNNIKLGPGGIREIEFIVQLFQLIRGGRDSELRQRPTLDVLAALAARNLLPAAAAEELTAAYGFLRNLEHRLQYLDDRQTQALPANPADQQLIAQSMGFTSYESMLKELELQRNQVSRCFEEIFASSAPENHALAGLWQEGADPEQCMTELMRLGFREPQDLLRRLQALRASNRYRQMAVSGQARLDQLVPMAVENAAAHVNPDATLERILRLLESVVRREAYLALLLEYPQALERVATLVSASPWVADYLTQHPILLDELLDARTLYAAPDWLSLSTTLRAQLDEAAGDVEKQMDLLRHFKHMQTLRLLAQDLAGELPLETLSDHLSDLADLILSQVLRITWQGLRSGHRELPRFAIVAYGKLGSKELGYASDLDLIFLYDDAAPEAAENYARLAQRLNNWLTSLTPAGVLYETDLRLRPDGASGLLVSSIEAFDEYQRKHAWVWEHQALTRARFCAGDAGVGEKFEHIRRAVLREQRDLDQLRRDIAAMRKKMLDAHPNRSYLFDLKHDRGGIVDVEFMVQYLVLSYAWRHSELTRNAGNLALLKLAGELGLIPPDLATQVHTAYREFRRRQHRLRLTGEKYTRVNHREISHHVATVLRLWQTVFGEGDQMSK